MTLFHFGNCFALAYFPYFITYKCSGLSEYSAFWRCVQAGATYVLVQLGKMLFLATFFPTWEGPSGGFDLVGEFLRATVDAADLGGLHLPQIPQKSPKSPNSKFSHFPNFLIFQSFSFSPYIFRKFPHFFPILLPFFHKFSPFFSHFSPDFSPIFSPCFPHFSPIFPPPPEFPIFPFSHFSPQEFLRATVDAADLGGLQLALGRGGGRGELRILVAALGWASAELLTARCVPLWVGARGVEFDWRHLQMGLDSNISLVRHVAAAALLWASGRHDLPPPLRLPLGGLLLATAYEGFLIGWAGQVLGLGPWGALGLRALGAAALGLGALRLLVPLLPPP